MAEYMKLNVWIFLAILVLQVVLCSALVKREAAVSAEEEGFDPAVKAAALAAIEPLEAELNEDAFGGDPGERSDREKRLGVIKKIGLKAVLLNLIFGKIDSFLDSKTRLINQLDKQNVVKNQRYFGITPPPKRPPNKGKPPRPTLLPPVEFSTNMAVSLVIPNELYGSSFSLITNVSRIVGDVLFNTADRAQEVADRVNAKIRSKFNIANRFIPILPPAPSSSSSSSSASSSASASSSSSSSSSASSDSDDEDIESNDADS